MSYIKFTEGPSSASGKTRTWTVLSVSNSVLAHIGWYAPWRKYCVGFQAEAVFDPGCLQEILDFCKQKTLEHKS